MSTNIQTQSTKQRGELMNDIQNKPIVWQWIIWFRPWWRIIREQEYHRVSAPIWEQDDIMSSGATSGRAKRPPRPSIASCRLRAWEHDLSACQSERTPSNVSITPSEWRWHFMMTFAMVALSPGSPFPPSRQLCKALAFIYLFFFFFCPYLPLIYSTRIPLSGVFVELRVSFNVSDCFRKTPETRKWTGNKGNQCTWLPLSPEILRCFFFIFKHAVLIEMPQMRFSCPS